MDRRATGFALVVVVMVAALTVPALAGVRIAGHPVAVAISPVPEAGNCLRQTESDLAPAQNTGVDRGAALTVPCALAHEAELISVTHDPDHFPMVQRGGVRYPDLRACEDAAYPFLGVRAPNEAGDRSAVLGAWWPATMGTFRFLSPNELQRWAGQSWLACALISPQGLVAGSSAGVFGSSGRSNPLALCRPSADVLLDIAISCRLPHAMELLGWRVADESVGGQRPLDQSCAELARRMTGMSDPTAGGELQVAAIVTHYDVNGVRNPGYGPGPHSERNRADCTVSRTGSRLLAGTLTGLGQAPVPWA